MRLAWQSLASAEHARADWPTPRGQLAAAAITKCWAGQMALADLQLWSRSKLRTACCGRSPVGIRRPASCPNRGDDSVDAERERADFSQRHKDAPDVWADPEPAAPAEGRKGLSISITVRLPAEEASLIRRLAEDLGVTYSEVVRKAVRHYVRPTFDLQITDLSSNLFYNVGSGLTGSVHTGIKFVGIGQQRGSFTAPSGRRG